jgi:plastocyanin
MDMTGRSIRGVAARLGVAAILMGMLTVGASPVLAADHAVDIAGFAFSPQSVTVHVGDTVTWTNADAAGHTATADDASFDTGTIAGGASASVTFATAGTFGYHCKIHQAMTATVVVRAAAGGGGGSTPGATVPPADAVTAVPPAGADHAAELALLGLTALVAFVLAHRRFGRTPG